MTQATPATQVDDETCIVTRCGFKPGEETGVHHNVINANDFDYSFVEIEFK